MKKKRIVNKKLLSTLKTFNCHMCGKSPPGDVHHLKSVGSGGNDEIRNLIALCRRCHSLIHAYGLTKISKLYSSVKYYLESAGWQFDTTRNKWFLPQ